MSQVSNQQVVDLFKRVYGDLHNLLPQDFPLAREIPFSEGRKVGDSFVEAFVLANETGWTLAGTGQDAFDLNPAIAGVVKQSSIIPSQVVLTSVIPFAFISRSAGGGEKAFYDGTKHVMQNHIRSHSRLLEAMRIHGQRAAKLGYVSYAPSGTVYRGATYSGAGDVTVGGIAFTDGVNTTSKAILIAPGNFAAGIWVGLEGCVLEQLDSASAVVASGKLVSVDADNGILYVDFVPVAATSTTSHTVCFEGMESNKEMVGVQKILENTGTLFGISSSQYALWKSNSVNLQKKRFSMKALQEGVAQAVNKGGLDKPLMIMVNPRTFAALTQDEAALRKYDASYKSAAQNGFETIEYYAANGLNKIVPHRMIMEGDVYGLEIGDWIRSGSAEISFKVPGLDKEIIFALENQAGYVVRSFSDQFVMCRAPARQIVWTNGNDEGVAY
jgi:hypothetical protein